MNGSEGLKFVIDTNVIFMALYNPESKAGKVIELANQNKIKLFSSDSVKIELTRVLKRELEFSDEQIVFTISNLPITWIEKEVYENLIDKTKVKHKADKPVEAVSLVLGCGILSANKHFKDRLNLDVILNDLKTREEKN